MFTPPFPERAVEYFRRKSYLQSQWLIIMGYFEAIMVYFGV